MLRINTLSVSSKTKYKKTINQWRKHLSQIFKKSILLTQTQIKNPKKMSKLELAQILGSSTSKPQHLAFAQDCLLYISGSFIVFYNPIVDEQISFLKHSSPNISSICVSGCQKLLAVCSLASMQKQKTFDSVSKKYNTITVYKLGQIGVNQPQAIIILKGHKHTIDHIVFSPDSKYIISVSNKDGSMFVWDCKTGQRLTQNKNTKNINSVKFINGKELPNVSRKDFNTYLVTIGRGNCKLWTFYTVESGTNLCRIKQQQQWIITGRTIALNKKFATKQFIDVCFWQTYILLLTSDGLLCMVSRNDKEQKLQKCIDLMITKTTSMDIIHNFVMCGGENAIIKVIDLDTLTLVRKFPKPPPTNKENIQKDYEEDQSLVRYQESEEFPQCIGVKTIGNNKWSQFIVTLYENLTIFIWRPEPLDMIAMRSIITHRASIKSVKILQQLKNDLTFFSTISQDNTLRIWHIYKKCIYNRESIDIAQLIGIKRNAYCRNLTRIIYMESQKEVTCISGFRNKSVACIAHKEFIMYSLENFQVVCHQMLEFQAVTLEVKGNLAYIGLENGKILVYEIIQQEGKLHKIREIAFDNNIKKMEMITLEEGTKNNELILAILTESQQCIVYSLKKSKITHIQKNCRQICTSGHNILMCKLDSLHIYNTIKQKSSQLLSLKHELTQPNEYITSISSNMLWIALTTSNQKLIIANFSPAIVYTEQFNQNINDVTVGESGEIILVGDYGDILVYRMQGNVGYEGMEQEVKKWMKNNDMSWMDNSVWAQRKSKQGGDRQLSGSVVDSIRLKSSINKDSSLKIQLPNVEIKYKSTANDQSVFNPSDILKQAKQIYQNIDGIEKKFNNNSNVREESARNVKDVKSQEKQVKIPKNIPKPIQLQDSVEQVKFTTNPDKPRPPIADSKQIIKKRIFGSLNSQNQNRQKAQINSKKSDDETQEGMPAQFRNNLVNSVIHSGNQQIEEEQQPDPQVKMEQSRRKMVTSNSNKNMVNDGENNFNEFSQQNKGQNSRVRQSIRQPGQQTKLFQLNQNQLQKQKQKELLSSFKQKLQNQQFLNTHSTELQQIHQILSTKLHNSVQVDRSQVLNEFNKLSKQFVKFLTNCQ